LRRTSASVSAAWKAPLSLAMTAGAVPAGASVPAPLVGDGIGEALLDEGRHVRENGGAFL